MAGSGLNIGLWIHERITEQTGLNVYPVQAGLDTPLPFVIYNRDSLELESDKSGVYYEVVGVSVALFAGDYTTSVNLANVVREALERTGKSAGISVAGVRIVGTAEEALEGGIWCQIINYEFDVIRL